MDQEPVASGDIYSGYFRIDRAVNGNRGRALPQGETICGVLSQRRDASKIAERATDPEGFLLLAMNQRSDKESIGGLSPSGRHHTTVINTRWEQSHSGIAVVAIILVVVGNKILHWRILIVPARIEHAQPWLTQQDVGWGRAFTSGTPCLQDGLFCTADGLFFRFAYGTGHTDNLGDAILIDRMR
ncbi:hypothetical protein MPH_09406 [Macrophomina phaseolina MS6]|uniref:Uncharacterized protein n=1 Tax=Macrophomina phaseolina (strain MS6) TaxID=1126212 RepID=K2S935_MACPH|nr:hypothetical protein MPH_09406 [Macrophomina phaseolina MS6]